MKNTIKTAIIPAAGRSVNEILAHTNLPDTMLPINGKPVIGYIIEDLIARNITQVIVVLNRDDTKTENHIIKKFSSKLSISIVRNNKYERGVGYSVFCACCYIDKSSSSILVYLGLQLPLK